MCSVRSDLYELTFESLHKSCALGIKLSADLKTNRCQNGWLEESLLARESCFL